MAKTHGKILSITRSMEIETRMRQPLMPVRVALIKNTRNNNGNKMGKGVEKRQSSYTVGGTVPMENTTQIPQKNSEYNEQRIELFHFWIFIQIIQKV